MQMVAEVAAENNGTTGSERLLMNASLTARQGQLMTDGRRRFVPVERCVAQLEF